MCKVQDLLIEAQNAINEVTFQYADNTWPEKLGYSRQDFVRIEEKIEKYLKSS